MTVNTQGNKRVDYAYNAINQVTNKKRYSDSTGTNLVAETNHTYDSLNRLTNITHSKGANTIASYTQTYDAGSKITSITSTDGNSTFNYDDTDQLVGADYNYQTDENYTYEDDNFEKGDQFRFFLTTQRLLQFSSNFKLILQTDGTYKLMWIGNSVLLLGSSDFNRVFNPVGLAVCSREAQ